MRSAPVIPLLLLAAGCSGGGAPHAESPLPAAAAADAPVVEKLTRSEQEWEALLTPKQFQVLRESGTERAFTGAYWDEHRDGTYLCAGCGLPLFSSEAKYESGTGWPSYWKPISPANVAEREDRSLFSVRTEIRCARCDGHLGHLFDDGPTPTGLRYCMNSAALRFEPAGGAGPK